ncbi:MAG: class I SAM-dependent methyltransferase [Ideonella sp.]|nr:class I SAM-dependent methyltransferase [Ideonella sp.]MCC7457190.1 class I SAM-dependent methyltransferase [Nitrospira sp.]
MPTNHDAATITAHYSRGGGLLERLAQALQDDGVDPQCPTLEQLAPYDQFHGRGVEATEEAAALMPARPGERLLDIGSGIGGPARWLARRFRCHVTGIDLTDEFCAVARELTQRTGMVSSVEFVVGDALALPWPDAGFDGAYTMNVSMNIADKARLHREAHRVLRPGGWLLLSEIARGAGPEPDYPTPWAASAAASFLATPQQTRDSLVAAGFEVLRFESTREHALAFAARSREAVARGEKPPHRAVMLMHGDVAAAAMRNSARALFEGRVEPIEVLARKAR